MQGPEVQNNQSPQSEGVVAVRGKSVQGFSEKRSTLKVSSAVNGAAAGEREDVEPLET